MRGGLVRVAAGSYDRTVRTVPGCVRETEKKHPRILTVSGTRRRRIVRACRSLNDQVCSTKPRGQEGSKLPAEVQRSAIALSSCRRYDLQPHGALLSVCVTLYRVYQNHTCLSSSLSRPTPVKNIVRSFSPVSCFAK